MSIRVVSKRAGGVKAKANETIVYIGRPSVLGNPYPMNSENERNTVIEKYRKWLGGQYNSGTGAVRKELEALAKRVRNGENIALECWCAPCKCHGDVIVKAIEYINNLK